MYVCIYLCIYKYISIYSHLILLNRYQYIYVCVCVCMNPNIPILSMEPSINTKSTHHTTPHHTTPPNPTANKHSRSDTRTLPRSSRTPYSIGHACNNKTLPVPPESLLQQSRLVPTPNLPTRPRAPNLSYLHPSRTKRRRRHERYRHGHPSSPSRLAAAQCPRTRRGAVRCGAGNEACEYRYLVWGGWLEGWFGAWVGNRCWALGANT